jgi:hypothetical protein
MLGFTPTPSRGASFLIDDLLVGWLDVEARAVE